MINPQHFSTKWFVELTQQRKCFYSSFVAHLVTTYQLVYSFSCIIKREVTKPLLPLFICQGPVGKLSTGDLEKQTFPDSPIASEFSRQEPTTISFIL